MWLDKIKVHETWNAFLTDEIIDELNKIESLVGTDYTPTEDKVLRFMGLDLSAMSVVILGQDPYKPAGVATGRSFEPADVKSWNDKYRQVSLKNIIRLVYKTYAGIERYSDIPSYSEIVKKIKAGGFKIKEPADWFNSLEEQGVLFLNTTLTCKIDESNSHKELWAKFSDELLKYISKNNSSLYWFMWGKEAISKLDSIQCGRVYRSKHPMMCSEKYADDFLKSDCFKDTMRLINWLG